MLQLKNIKTGKKYFAVISDEKLSVTLFINTNNNSNTKNEDIVIDRRTALREYEPIVNKFN